MRSSWWACPARMTICPDRSSKSPGLTWDRKRSWWPQIDEVMPHPNADRLVLCRLNDGQQEHVVLTGAPNLFQYKGKGPLEKPLKVAYAKEGARIYDGHQPGQVLTTLKRAKIRGVESYSMVCSEKELGISEEHEGIILLDGDAPDRHAAGRLHGRCGLRNQHPAQHDPQRLRAGRGARSGCRHRENAAQAATEVPHQGRPLPGRSRSRSRSPELNPRFVLG